MSVENVEFTTEGLFLTLGNIMPPLRESGLAEVDVVVAAEEADADIVAADTPTLPAELAAATCAAVTVYEVRVGWLAAPAEGLGVVVAALV